MLERAFAARSAWASTPRRRRPLGRSRRIDSALLSIALFAVYLATLAPTVHWLDGGELTAAAFHLSPAHPPGEPAYILMGRLAALLPLGSIAFRVNLLSAACGAVSLWLAHGLAVRLLMPAPASEARSASGSRRTLAAMAALAPFLTTPVWLQGVRAEVYMPQLMLVLATLAALVQAGLLEGRLDPRWTTTAALFLGIDLAVHPLLAVLAGLPLGAAALARRGSWAPRTWAVAASAGALGFSSYLLLPLRASVHPSHGWGTPVRLEPFLDVALARTFRRNFSPLTPALVGHNLEVIEGALVAAAGPVLLLLALAGLAALVAQRRWRTAWVLAGLVAFNLWSILPQNKVFAENPDFHGYLALDHLVIWWLAALALAWSAERLEARVRPANPLAVVFLASLALPATLVSLADADRSRDTLARRFGEAALRGLPPGGYLQVSGNDTTFILTYLQEVERLRPDVRILSRTLLSHDWYRARFPYEDGWKIAAAGPAGEFIPWIWPRALRVELRAPDLPYSRQLCPAPAPGWGFYEMSTACPGLEGPGSRPAAAGLTFDPRAWHGPEALLVGINARAFLADYYDAIGRSRWAAEERADLARIAPGLEAAALSSRQP